MIQQSSRMIWNYQVFQPMIYGGPKSISSDSHETWWNDRRHSLEHGKNTLGLIGPETRCWERMNPQNWWILSHSSKTVRFRQKSSWFSESSSNFLSESVIKRIPQILAHFWKKVKAIALVFFQFWADFRGCKKLSPILLIFGMMTPTCFLFLKSPDTPRFVP